MLLNLDIEPEGRAVILAGLQKINCLRDLQAALADDAEDCELHLEKLADVEIRAAAGLFFALAQKADPERFSETQKFCVEMFAALNDEFNFRRSPARGAALN